MPDREHTDRQALERLWRLPMSAALGWFDPIRTAISNFFFGIPPILVEAAIPEHVAGLCLDCSVFFDTRRRQACPQCASTGWILFAGSQRKERRGRRLTPASAAVVPIRRKG